MRNATGRAAHILRRILTGTFAGVILAVSVVGAGTGAVEAAPDSYTVRAGDSWYGIANKFDVTAATLARANATTTSSAIHPGDIIIIPANTAGHAGVTTTRSSGGAGRGPGTYVVRAGDSLYAIASRNKISLTSLLAANQMTAQSLILPGTKLVLPTSTASPAGRGNPTSTTGAPGGYTITGGDTLSGIASKHGVSLRALLNANGLTSASLILAGRTLHIPTPASAPTVEAPAGTPVEVPAGAPVAPSGQADTVVAFLYAQIGKPYRYAAAGPDAYDCSGLVAAAYGTVGVSLPHQSIQQAASGVAVDWASNSIQAGDLIFVIGNGKNVISHVGVAISSTQWIHATRPGENVKLATLPTTGRIAAVRRIL